MRASLSYFSIIYASAPSTCAHLKFGFACQTRRDVARTANTCTAFSSGRASGQACSGQRPTAVLLLLHPGGFFHAHTPGFSHPPSLNSVPVFSPFHTDTDVFKFIPRDARLGNPVRDKRHAVNTYILAHLLHASQVSLSPPTCRCTRIRSPPLSH